MKKVLETLRIIFCVLAVVCLAGSFAMGSLFGAIDVFTIGITTSLPLILGVGAVLYLTAKGNANRVGAGLILASIIISSAITFAGLKGGIAFDTIICLIADAFFLLSFAVAFIKFCVCKEACVDSPEDDPKIKKVLAWKKLEEQGIISAEEFEEKRVELLGLKSKK